MGISTPDPDILRRIVEAKRGEIKERMAQCNEKRMAERAQSAPPPRGFARRLTEIAKSEGGAFICEVKRASPSRGVIREDFDVHALAGNLERAGAACLSVLTDSRFDGELAHLAMARNATALPLLRKDFILVPYQVYESRAAGADAILLLAAALRPCELKELSELAREMGLDCLGEVHDEYELASMLDTGVELIGINNRNLRTFDVSLETTATLLPLVPEGRMVVSESGVSSAGDVARLRGYGAQGFLVGESLMSNPDPGNQLAALKEGLRPGYLSSAAPR